MTADRSPRVTVSLPCPRCPDNDRPEPDCSECGGDGIILLKVRPEHAALEAAELTRLYRGERRQD